MPNAQKQLRRKAMMGPIRNRWRLSRLLPVGMLQENERSCSVASIAMLVNAARSLGNLSRGNLSDIGESVSQKALLQQVGNATWNSAVGPGGDGVELDDMAGLVRQSLSAYGFSRFEIEVVHVDRVTSEARLRARRELIETAHSPARFIIANFLQGIYTQDAAESVGHYAPVAAFDLQSGSALIFDPDPRGYRPYWVGEERFLEGMATRDESSGISRGYLSVRL